MDKKIRTRKVAGKLFLAHEINLGRVSCGSVYQWLNVVVYAGFDNKHI